MGALARRMAAVVAAYRPSWGYDFAAAGAIPPGSTFARASSGTYFDAMGILRYADANAPRFDCDPLTRAFLGYLAEPQATNTFLQSGACASASWLKTRASAVAAQAVAPDGTTTMAFIQDTTPAQAHLVAQNLAFTAGTTYVVSCYAKAGTRNWVFLSFSSLAFTGNIRCFFNLATGTVGTPSGGITAGMSYVGNGIYRCWISAVATITAAAAPVSYGLAASNATPNYDGDGVSGLYLCGAQCETGQLTSYIPTTTAAATRAGDVLTMPLALLPAWEAARGGVLALDYQLNGSTGANQYAASISDALSQNSVSIRANNGGGSVTASMQSGNVRQFSISNGGSPAPLTLDKVAIGWSASRGVLSRNGGAPVTASGSYTLPVSPPSLYLGVSPSGGSLNGWIKRARWYGGERSDAFIQGVTL